MTHVKMAPRDVVGGAGLHICLRAVLKLVGAVLKLVGAVLRLVGAVLRLVGAVLKLVGLPSVCERESNCPGN